MWNVNETIGEKKWNKQINERTLSLHKLIHTIHALLTVNEQNNHHHFN